MKTDEMQAAAGSAAAGSLSAHVWRPMGAAGATGRWSASVLRLWFGGTGRWSASVLRLSRAPAVGSSTLDPTHAAALKSEQLWSSSPQPFSSPTFALIVFEFAFAAWLLTGWLPRLTWWLAVGCFTTFALVALGKLLQGDPDCGCFGAARTPPLFALVVDLAALVCLWFARSCTPNSGLARPQYAWVVLLGLVPLTAYRWNARGTELVEVAPGLQMSRDIAIVDPSQWTPGMPFPLLPYIEASEDLSVGDWTLLVIRPGCPQCQAALPRAVAAQPSLIVVSVVPQHGEPGELVRGYLLGADHWDIAPPLTLCIADGLFVSMLPSHELEKGGKNP